MSSVRAPQGQTEAPRRRHRCGRPALRAENVREASGGRAEAPRRGSEGIFAGKCRAFSYRLRRITVRPN